MSDEPKIDGFPPALSESEIAQTLAAGVLLTDSQRGTYPQVTLPQSIYPNDLAPGTIKEIGDTRWVVIQDWAPGFFLGVMSAVRFSCADDDCDGCARCDSWRECDCPQPVQLVSLT